MQRLRILSATASALLLFLHHSATAQNQTADSLISEISSGPSVTYTVQQCIDSALRNNATVKLADFTARSAQVARLQQIGNMIPTLSGLAQYYNSGGKSINTFTNQYVTQNYNQGYGQVTGSVILFNGLSLLNYLKQYSLAYEADKKDWQYQRDLITITIIQDYFTILANEEQLALAQRQAADNRHRADLMKIQDSVGSIAHSLLTDQQALVNTNELTIVTTKNAVEQSKLKLAQDMNVPYSPNMEIVKLNIDPAPVVYNASVDQVYQNATHNIAAIQGAELHVEAAKKGVLASRGNMSPTLSLFYGVSTNYSSAAATNPLLNTTYGQTDSYVTINGVNTPVFSPQYTYGNQKIPFNTQFKNNVYTQIGVQLSIPILNRLQYRVLYKNAIVARDQAVFNQKTINANLRQAVESSYVTMMQNFRTYNVTYKEVGNYEESYREASIKYDNGALSSLDFVIYNTNKNNAELNLIAAKYSYLLATKVLDYYQGQLTW
ncbi:MAG TPA: TolC family protein [Puia sp.]|nr:TolC family protein [Puia sp.]